MVLKSSFATAEITDDNQTTSYRNLDIFCLAVRSSKLGRSSPKLPGVSTPGPRRRPEADIAQTWTETARCRIAAKEKLHRLNR